MLFSTGRGRYQADKGTKKDANCFKRFKEGILKTYAKRALKNAKNDRFTVLSKMTVCEGDVMKFQVSPKHGSGQESIIRVVDGMYVTYTDCCVDHGESSNTDDYHEIICMYQLFEGEAQINFKNNRACFIKKMTLSISQEVQNLPERLLTKIVLSRQDFFVITINVKNPWPN